MLVTGGAGFLGEHVVRKLIGRGVTPSCFVRQSTDTSVLRSLGVPLKYGDLAQAESLAEALKGEDVLVNIASLGFGHGAPIVQACLLAGVKRAVFISTTAVFTTLEARTKAIRLEAERLIKESGMDWTIIRPTMIYGTERDRNMVRLIRFLSRWPIMPVPGSGNNLQQPIHVEDLADVIISAVENPCSIGKAYNVSGREPLTYNQVIDETARALSRKVAKVHLPVWPAVKLLSLYEQMVSKPRLKAEQILRLNEDKAFSHEEAAGELGFSPRSFADGIGAEVSRLKSKALL